MAPTPLRNYKRYPEESIRAAISSVKEHGMPTAEAAKMYGVPPSTLRDRLKGKRYNRREIKVSKTALSNEHEEKLVSWMEESAQRGFGCNRAQILDTVQHIVKQNCLQTPFKDGRPGKRWFRCFMKRHKEKLSIEAVKAVGCLKAGVCAPKIKDWCSRTYQEIIAIDPDMFNHPERILSCNETVFQLGGGMIRMEAHEKDKRINQMPHDARKQVTVLACGSASGGVHQPLLICPGKRFSYDPLAGFPEAHSAMSDNGWINSDIFATWLENAFIPAVEHLEKPVILFVDGHSCHHSLDVSGLCSDHNIILYRLPSYYNRSIQPLELTTFEALRNVWREEVFKYQEENCSLLGRSDFSKVFKKAWQRGMTKDVVISGFKAAGIYPWDPDHIDLSKLPNPVNSMVTDEVPEESVVQEFEIETLKQESSDDDDDDIEMTEIQQTCDDTVTDDTAIVSLCPPKFSRTITSRPTALPALPPSYSFGQDDFEQTDDTTATAVEGCETLSQRSTASSSSSLDDISPLIALDKLLDVTAKFGIDRLCELKRLHTLERQAHDAKGQLFLLLFNRVTNKLRNKGHIIISNNGVEQPYRDHRQNDQTSINSNGNQGSDDQQKMIISESFRKHNNCAARKKKDEKEGLEKKRNEIELNKSSSGTGIQGKEELLISIKIETD